MCVMCETKLGYFDKCTAVPGLTSILHVLNHSPSAVVTVWRRLVKTLSEVTVEKIAVSSAKSAIFMASRLADIGMLFVYSEYTNGESTEP